jgi:hypothetical protein
MSQDRLINELMHNAQVANASGKILEQRLADTAAWFFANKDRIPLDNLAAKQKFLEKAVWMLIEIAALQADRIHQLEGNGSSLWLPKGLAVRGDVKKFG